MMPRQPKPFDPKPFKPGAALTWSHVFPDGSEVQRTGTVWSEAPTVPGYGKPCWVIPDEPLPSDLYSAVVVAVVSREYVDLHAGLPWQQSCSGVVRRKGEVVSANHPGSPLGGLANAAGQRALALRGASAYELAT